MEKQLLHPAESGQMGVVSLDLLSKYLSRIVKIDFYYSELTHSMREWNLVLANDGQDLVQMDFSSVLSAAEDREGLEATLFVGIHCGEDRMNEYGMSSSKDYLGRGSRSGDYEQFVLSELLPFIDARFDNIKWKEKMFMGFSLGGLSALDIAWNNAMIFSRVGVFSGSFWWRSLDTLDKNYSDSKHRLMHQQIKNGAIREGMKFFFECGELDETEDRNKNGVIDSIDDTIDLMRELQRKGYREGKDMCYLQLADGRHDVPSWGRAIPVFLNWALR